MFKRFSCSQAVSLWLPQFNWISFGIVPASESSVRVNLRVSRDVNLGGSQLLHHCIKIANAKIDHPLLVSSAEIICIVRKWGEYRRPGFLRPRLLIVVCGHRIDSQMLLIPLAQCRRILRAEEQTSNSGNMLHTCLAVRPTIYISVKSRSCKQGFPWPTHRGCC
jgi:hypothetical protein